MISTICNHRKPQSTGLFYIKNACSLSEDPESKHLRCNTMSIFLVSKRGYVWSEKENSAIGKRWLDKNRSYENPRIPWNIYFDQVSVQPRGLAGVDLRRLGDWTTMHKPKLNKYCSLYCLYPLFIDFYTLETLSGDSTSKPRPRERTTFLPAWYNHKYLIPEGRTTARIGCQLTQVDQIRE